MDKREGLFHFIFVCWSIFMLGCRSYYNGFTAAAGEKVPKFDEGIFVRFVRYTIGIPFVLFMFAYLVDSGSLAWSKVDLPFVVRLIGSFILISSACAYCWTHKYLGKNFTDTVFVRKNNKLVEIGPYRYVRHPMYVSGILITVGASLTAADWGILVFGLALMLFVMYVRTPLEETNLLVRHGEAYKKYMQRTGRFFPKIRG